MANIIMKYQEQFINFPGKQGVAIKSKKALNFFTSSPVKYPGEVGAE